MNKGKILWAVLSMFVFVVLIANADKLGVTSGMEYVNPVFIGNSWPNPTINMDEIPTTIDDTENGVVVKYIAKEGDTLESIASEFGITVSNLKKINNISSIHPWEKIIVTDEEDGIIYTVRETQNIKVFANKYNLNLQELMTLNYITDDTEILQEGQELFINISNEKANTIAGFIDKAQPNLAPQVIKPKPKPTTTTTPKPTSTSNSSTSSPSSSNVGSVVTDVASTLSKRTYTKNITNGFARGYCTWYVATQKPSLFPYSSETSQTRTFGGNANQRYKNAQAAGISVWQSPKAGAIVVYSNLRNSAWHVWIVRSVDTAKWTMVVEDMNYEWKFVVTKRVESINRGGIIWYIYG